MTRMQIDEIVYFSKVKEGAIIPSKREEDFGWDIYACFPEAEILIEPHKTVLIPTGIASACSKRYGFLLQERGSTGTKGMAQRCGVIDSGYRSEWFVPITNTTNIPIVISKIVGRESDQLIVYPYSKAICQAILVEVPVVTVKEIPYSDLVAIDSERGMGHLGSSGK